jgi:hypothetical protein
MGYYLNVGEVTGKAAWLIKYYRAQVTAPPHVLSPPHGKAVICVTENGTYDEVLLITTQREFERRKNERRKTTWLLMNFREARKLAGVLI